MTTRAPLGGVPPALLRAAAALRRAVAWRRLDVRRIDLRQLVVGDLALKSAAVVVAIVLFIWVSAVYAPPAEVTVAFDGHVPIERPDVPAGSILVGQLGEVTVRLRGPEDAVRAVGQEQLRASLDLAAAVPRPEPQEIPVRVAVADARVRVVEVMPASILVRLERRTERDLALQARFANEPPAGYRASEATFRPQQVTVAGPESAVANVVAVLATLRFGDTPIDLAQDVRPTPVDAAGREVEGVEVDPVSVRVNVPVLSKATTRTVPILWRFSGDVGTGYWISRVVTDPVAVTVSGDRDAIEALERIETAPVDVGGLTSGRTFATPLVVPAGIALVGAVQATVSVTVVALVGTRPFPLVAVQATGMGDGLVAEIDPRAVDVTLSGTVPVLASLAADAVAAVADLAGRGPGTYTVEVAVRAPAGTAVSSVQPARVTVTLRPKASPAP